MASAPHRLARVERAEAAVRRLLAAHGDLRVRDLGDAVRVEVDAHLVAAAQGRRRRCTRRSARPGFDGVPVSVAAFRSGSMNELLPDRERWRDA